MGQVSDHFAQTGNFFLKTAASLAGKTTIYKKGDPFEVYVGRDGYSVLTITFAIKENAVYDFMDDGEQISKDEFDRN